MTTLTTHSRNKYKKYINPPHRFIQKMSLHKNQQTIWNVYFSGKYRALVINAGRRFGKSTVCMAIAVELAVNYGKNVWWVGKTNKDSGKQWRNAKQLLLGIYTNKSEVDHRMEFHYDLPNGTKLRGELNFRSAEVPDNLRGDGIDLLILDEAAFHSSQVWTVLRPALTDKKGDVIFISTPNGHNWFYELFQRGNRDNPARNPRWWSKHYTSYDNPLIDPAEIDASKLEGTETDFRIEHLAEFIDDIGKVFTNVYDVAKLERQEPPKGLGNYVMGIDLARKHDATVVSIIDTDTLHQVYGERFIGQDWELQKAKIAGFIKAWSPQAIIADATALGQPVVEDLQKLVPYHTITPFILSGTSKPQIIQKLSVMIQNKKLKLLSPADDFGRIQTEELLAYEVKKSKDGMKSVYGAPEGGKDDTVMALALAVSGINEVSKVLQVTSNPFYGHKIPEKPAKFRKSTSVLSVYAKKSLEIQKKLIDEYERSLKQRK